jgi:peptidoglycan/LPS O-acetylase OafA/YrhL
VKSLYSVFARRPGRARVEAIDGLRALAAIWVIGLHTLSLTGSFWVAANKDVHVFGRQAFISLLGHPMVRILAKGYLAVDVFFVLSGFLIATSLLRELRKTGALSVTRFYRNRFFRLFPAYACVIVLFALFGRGDRETLWTNIVYVNNFVPTYDQFMLHAWSLAVEEQFYILFPFVLLVLYRLLGKGFFAKAGAGGWIALIALGLGLRLFVIVKAKLWLHLAPNPIVDREACAIFTDVLDDKLYTRFGALGCGVLAAHWNENGAAARFFARKGAGPWVALTASLVAFVVVCSPSPVGPPPDAATGTIFLTLYQTLFAGGVAFLVCACANEWRGVAPLHRVLRLRGWYPLAELSYGAYLLHPLVIQRVYLLLPPASPSPVVAIGYFVAFAVAAFVAAVPLYVWVEAPGMQLREAAVRRRPAEAVGIGQ